MTAAQLLASPSPVLSALTLGLLLALLGAVLLRRPPPVLWPALPLLLSAGVACVLGDLLSQLATDALWHELALTLFYGGLIWLPAGWWVLAHRLADYHDTPLPTPNAFCMWSPVVAAGALWLLMLTNPLHGQFLTPTVGGRSEFHAGWYVHATLGHFVGALTVIYFAVLLRRAKTALARSHFRILLVGTALTAMGNVSYVLPAVAPDLDLTVVAIGVTAALFMAGIRWGRLFGLSPVTIDALLHHLPVGTLLLDTEGRLMRSNPAAEEALHGLDLRAGTDVFRLLAPRLVPETVGVRIPAAQLRGQLERSRLPVDFVLEPSERGEELRWLQLQLVPVPGRGRHSPPQGWCLQVEDRSVLRRAELAQKRGEVMLRRVFDEVPAYITATDADGRYLLVNRNVAEESSLEPEDFVGRSDAELGLDTPAKLPLNEPDDQVLQRGRPYLAPVRWVEDRAGRRRAFRIAKLPFLIPGDGRPAVLTMATEITEAKQAEQALVQAQKLESLGTMAGGIAEDFNALMSVVRENCEAALARVGHDLESQDLLCQVHDASVRAGGLTAQLSAYAGRRRLEAEDLDLSELVADLSGLLRRSLPPELGLRFDLSADPVWVRGDPDQLRQVVMSLVTNAVEAIGDQPGAITVATGADPAAPTLDDADGLALLEVRDSGPGVPADAEPRLFDPFYSTRGPGRGLGLAAVAGIVRTHNGRMRVGRAEEGGACLTVMLPTAAAAPEHGLESAAFPRGVRRALVVASDPGTRRLVQRMLQVEEVEVVCPRRSEEAPRAVAQDDFDLAILDAEDDDEARALLQALRAEQPELAAVLVSSRGAAALGEALGGAPRAAGLGKPFTLGDLAEAIRHATGGR